MMPPLPSLPLIPYYVVAMKPHTPGEKLMRPFLGILKTANRLIDWLRARYYRALVASRCAGWSPPLRVNGRVLVNRDTHLGRNVNFNGFEIQGSGRVVIGDNFHSGSECLIITEVHDYDGGDTIPYGAASILKETVIGDNVWFGSRVTVVGGVEIGEGAIIQAGAVG